MLFALILGVCTAITLFCMSYRTYTFFLQKTHTLPDTPPSRNPTNPHNKHPSPSRAGPLLTFTSDKPVGTNTDNGNDMLLPGECNPDLVASGPDNHNDNHGNDHGNSGEVLLPYECDPDLVAEMLGVSTKYVSTLFKRGKLPLPCSYDPLRWEKTEIESWLQKNVHDRVTLILLFCLQPLNPTYGDTTNKHLNDQVNQLLARMSSKETLTVLRRFLSQSPTSEHPEREQALLEALLETLFVESLANNHPNALNTQIKDAYRLFHQQETGEPPKNENPSNPADATTDISPGEKGFLEFFAQNIAGPPDPEPPPNEDEPIPDFVLPSPHNSFSWDNWKQPNAPFLWTLTNIAHALGSDFETAKKWYREGNIPKPAWNDHLLWHGDTIKLPIWHGTEIKPWIDNVTALTNKILQNLPNPTPNQTSDTTPDNPTPDNTAQDQTSDTTPTDPTPADAIPPDPTRDVFQDRLPDNTTQDDLPPNTIDLTLHKAGLFNLSDIADTLDHDSATLRQWHYEGCPGHPMPYPDLIEKNVPYWFYDGKIADWIDTLPTSLTKTHNQTNPNPDPKLALDPHNPTQPSESPESPESTGHTLPIEPTLPDTNLVSLPEIARTTGIPIPTLRDWAVHGIFCPPLDVSPPTAPGYGYWHRDTIIPWLDRHDTRNKNTRPQNKPSEDTDVPSSHRTTIRPGEETNVGKLWNETQQNFERLGDTATHTDLANLAGDYPLLLAHATELGRLPAWLIKTADHLALAGFWNAFDITPDSITGNTPAATFARGAHGLWLYRNGTLEDAQACLSEAARNPLLPQNARDLLTLRNAAVLRLTAGWNIAQNEFATITTREGSLGVQVQYWNAVSNLAQNKFRTGLDMLPTPDELPDITGDYWINIGWTHMECALVNKAIAAQKKTLQHARSIGSPLAEGEALANLTWSEAWTDPDTAKTHAREAIRLTHKTGNLFDQQDALVVLAIATAGTAPDEEFHATRQEAEDLAYQTGNRRGTLYVHFARAWHAAIKNDHETLGRCITEIEQLAALLDAHKHWADIARAWLPGQTRETTELAARWEWLDSPEDTMRRWRQLLDNRKALAG